MTKVPSVTHGKPSLSPVISRSGTLSRCTLRLSILCMTRLTLPRCPLLAWLIWSLDFLSFISSHLSRELIIKSTSETQGYSPPLWRYVHWFRGGRATALYTRLDGAAKSSSSPHQRPFTQLPRIRFQRIWRSQGVLIICERVQYSRLLVSKMAKSRTCKSILACITL
jgi:hypothetical protein